MQNYKQPPNPSPAGCITGSHWRRVWGLFITPMQNDGTFDYYRHLAETNPDIAVLVDMIDRLQAELVIALTAAIRP
jgi:hypothetical protein